VDVREFELLRIEELLVVSSLHKVFSDFITCKYAERLQTDSEQVRVIDENVDLEHKQDVSERDGQPASKAAVVTQVSAQGGNSTCDHTVVRQVRNRTTRATTLICLHIVERLEHCSG